MFSRLPLCAALLALPSLAFAQADDSAVPASTCVKPAIPAVDAAIDNKAAEKLNADVAAYSACAEAYMKARRATAEKYQGISNAHQTAANALAVEFNGWSTALNAFGAARTAKDKKKK